MAGPTPPSAFESEHCVVDLLAIGEGTVGQRMLSHDLRNGVLDAQIVFLRTVDRQYGQIFYG